MLRIEDLAPGDRAVLYARGNGTERKTMELDGVYGSLAEYREFRRGRGERTTLLPRMQGFCDAAEAAGLRLAIFTFERNSGQAQQFLVSIQPDGSLLDVEGVHVLIESKGRARFG